MQKPIEPTRPASYLDLAKPQKIRVVRKYLRLQDGDNLADATREESVSELEDIFISDYDECTELYYNEEKENPNYYRQLGVYNCKVSQAKLAESRYWKDLRKYHDDMKVFMYWLEQEIEAEEKASGTS